MVETVVASAGTSMNTRSIVTADLASGVDLARGQSLSEQVRESLESMVISGVLLPGSRIDEAELTQKFNVSRTPMREAIKALIATGMLENRPRQGVSVAALSTSALLEMFEVMSMLEGMCAKYAARRAAPEQIAMLEEIHTRLENAMERADPELFYSTNLEFHEVIYAATHTDFLADQTRSLRRRVAMYWKQVTFLPGRMAGSIKEHLEIIRAIKTKDSKLAELAASQHICLLGDNMIDFIARLPRTIISD
ncbi:GntR family transcriptional regulator [Rhizobium sp. ZPR3]|uniref:GntR family transcriptional regulator n=2 Tax=unclassified Rhizobium TaxID=2613769 RepID=A0AAU7SQR8_9HYPH